MSMPLNLAVISFVFATGVSVNHAVFAATPAATPRATSSALIQKIKQENPQLSQAALLAGIRAYTHLRRSGKDKQQLLTIVNFNRPSNEKRLWVINMKNGDTQYVTYVAHGQKSGLNRARHFSNRLNSHESSIGVYLTGHTYTGRDGHSLRLHGLDRGFNSNAFARDIVMHPATYVSQRFAQQYGRMGRTYGCFGLSEKIAPHIISAIKNGTVIVAYYPNKQWLQSSRYEQPL